MASPAATAAHRLTGRMQKNVWIEFMRLGMEHKPVDLGQGFPDYSAAPAHLLTALSDVVHSDNPLLHQYTRSGVR